MHGIPANKYQREQQLSNYAQNGYRPAKLRSLNREPPKMPTPINHGLNLHNYASREKLSAYSGNFDSPNQPPHHPVLPARRPLGNSKIGTGVMKILQGERGDFRERDDSGSPLKYQQIGHIRAGNNSNTSTNENSLGPLKGRNKIIIDE